MPGPRMLQSIAYFGCYIFSIGRYPDDGLEYALVHYFAQGSTVSLLRG